MSELDRGTRIASIYEQWSRGDFASSIPELDSNFEICLRPDFPDSGTYTGLEQVAAYMENFLAAWDRLLIEAEEIREFGDRVLARIRQHASGSRSGIPVELRYFHVWTFDGDSIVRVEAIREEQDAIRAAKGEA